MITTSRGLARDTLWYGGAVAVDRIAGVLLVPLLTRHLSQQLYAVWTQIVVSGGLVPGVILLGFQTAAVRFLAGIEDRACASAMLHGMLALLTVTGAAAAALAVTFSSPLSRLMFGDAAFAPYVGVTGAFWVSEAFFELVAAFLRARQDIPRLSLYLAAKNIGRITLLAACIAVRVDLLTAVILLVAAQSGLAAVMYVHAVLREVGMASPLRHIRWRPVFGFALPLVPYGILMWTNNFIDRYLILHTLDLRALSTYAIAYSLAASIGLLYSLLSYTLYPHMSARWNAGDPHGTAETLRRATEIYLIAVGPAVVIVTLLGERLIRLLATSAYVPDVGVMFGLAVGIVLFGLYQIHIIATLLADRVGLNFGILAIAVTTNIGANVLFIPALGVPGAAVATVLSNAVLAVWTTLATRRVLPYHFPWRVATTVLVATVAMAVPLLVLDHWVSTADAWTVGPAVAGAVGVYAVVGWTVRPTSRFSR